MKSNPWFWAGLSRWEFERNLVRDAVYLRDKNARVKVPKVSIEEVRARKTALTAKGINIAAINGSMSAEVKARNIATMATASVRKIK